MDEVVAIFGMLAPKGWVMIAFVCAIAALLGWAISRYATRRRTLWLGLAAPLPVYPYLVVFLILPPAKEGTQLGWFMAGLMMISPLIVGWLITLAVGFMLGRSRGAGVSGVTL